jgi:crotonobetainyl-CoA:carnitine CoA-transferase CaiB-like acyl-CoA transferase
VVLTNTPDAACVTSSVDEVMHHVPRVTTAGTATELQSDGVAALGVASAILTALVGRDRGHPINDLRTSMLATVTHLLTDWVVDYTDAPQPLAPRHNGNGLSALYRIYGASEGYIFLAAPQAKEWPPLVAALQDFADLGDDQRFSTPEAREANDDELARCLEAAFSKESAAFWEKHLGAAGLGCVELYEGAPARLIQTDPQLAAEYTVPAVSPIFDEHLRFSPLVGLSRSEIRAPGGCLAGQHTVSVLREFGYDDATIAKWQDAGVIHCG